MDSTSYLDYDTALENRIKQLALESEVLANVITTFRNVIPNLLSMLKEKTIFINISKNKEDELSEIIVKLSKDYKQLSKKIPQVPFASVNQTLISVPENFYGSFLEYSTFLNTHIADLYTSANFILSDYRNTLAVFLSNQNTVAGLSDYNNIYRNVKKTRESLTVKFREYFPRDTGLSKQKLAVVIDRFADLDKLIHEVTILDKKQQKQSLTIFKASVDQCVKLLELVVKRTEENSVEKISGETAKNIAVGAFEIGKCIELVALSRFKVQQFIIAVDNTIEELNTKLS